MRLYRSLSFIVLISVLVLGLGVSARAQNCQEDLTKIQGRREAQMAAMNKLVKAGHGKIDPVAACPKLRQLVAIEGEFANYLKQNKDWCHVPDEAVASIQKSRDNSANYAAKACNAAAQEVKARQNAEQGGGATGQPQFKLPQSPL